jgi:hypothetical protein
MRIENGGNKLKVWKNKYLGAHIFVDVFSSTDKKKCWMSC